MTNAKRHAFTTTIKTQNSSSTCTPSNSLVLLLHYYQAFSSLIPWPTLTCFLALQFCLKTAQLKLSLNTSNKFFWSWCIFSNVLLESFCWYFAWDFASTVKSEVSLWFSFLCYLGQVFGSVLCWPNKNNQDASFFLYGTGLFNNMRFIFSINVHQVALQQVKDFLAQGRCKLSLCTQVFLTFHASLYALLIHLCWPF